MTNLFLRVKTYLLQHGRLRKRMACLLHQMV